MEIKNLSDTPLEQIVATFLEAFSDYFVPMSSDVAYWRNRFKGARVDYSLSYGMFDDGQLVGFIINGIDYLDGELTAFNTGTGVIQSYRGQGIVDQLYAYAIPFFKEKGITKCALEVIQLNHKAIRVYERIGFHITKSYKCFKGDIKPSDNTAIIINEVEFSEIEKLENPFKHLYAWDNQDEAIKQSLSTYKCYNVAYSNGEIIGYFVINPSIGYLPQFEVTAPTTKENCKMLLEGIRQISPTVKINNVVDTRPDLVNILLEMGLENHIDQYHMIRDEG